MSDALIITSPFSGRNKKDKKRIKRLEGIVKKADRKSGNSKRSEVIVTSSVSQLEYVVKQIFKLKPEVIVMDGGDGTVALFVGLLLQHMPKGYNLPYQALLPGGTFNLMAKVVGSKKFDEEKYLEDIIMATDLEKLPVRDFDMMKIRDDRGVEKYGFSFGVGFPVTLLEEAYKQKKWKYLWLSCVGAKLIGSIALQKTFGRVLPKKWVAGIQSFLNDYYQRFGRKYHLNINGDEGEWFGFMAQTIQTIGAPFSKPFYMAHLSQKKFHAMGTKLSVIKDTDIFSMAAYSWMIYTGRGNLIQGLDINRQLDKTYITSEEEFKYQVNGDLEHSNGKKFIANRVDIEPGSTLQLILPQPKL
ncbi:MAG: diacylglycerol kinase family protein [Candidatus Woesearchaeota archaeon]